LERAAEFEIDPLLLLPDHALDRRGAATAIFLRPVQAHPAALRLLPLPRLGHLDDVVLLQFDTAKRSLQEFCLELLRRVGVDPRPRLCAERGLLRRVVEIHRRVLLSDSEPPTLPSPLAGEGGEHRKMRDGGGGFQITKSPLTRLRVAQSPSPARGEGKPRELVAPSASPLRRYLVERHVLVDPDVAGQAEHALGDDVAHDFVGPPSAPRAGAPQQHRWNFAGGFRSLRTAEPPRRTL